MVKLRQALIEQNPSLALQRAAADEIAKLDSQLILLETYILTLEKNANHFIPHLET